MNRIYIYIFVLFNLPVILFANGAPFKTNFVFKTFNPTPIEVKSIRIIKENLDIRIVDDYSIVNVEYTMKNDGANIEFEYGFPVDFFLRSQNNNVVPAKEWNPENIKDIIIMDESIRLEIYQKFDTVLYKDKLKSKIIFYDEVKVARRWFFTKIKFSAYQEKKITVRYTVSNTVFDMLMSDRYFVLYSDRVLTYDFSPAAYFGNSLIDDFNIHIHISRLESCNCKYNIDFGESFENKNGVLTLNKKNFDLKSSEKLYLVYRMDNIYKTNVPHNLRFGQKWFRSVKSNMLNKSNLTSFLFDGDMSSSWTGKKGKGDWLELAFGTDSVSYIGIINGNTTDRQSFYDYPRIRKLKLEIQSKSFYRYVQARHLILELEDKDYNYFNKSAYGSFITTLFDLGQDFYDDIKKIRITVLDVYPGRKYNAISIGELFVYKYRNLQPPIERFDF